MSPHSDDSIPPAAVPCVAASMPAAHADPCCAAPPQAVAHDLLTPVASIVALLEYLEGEPGLDDDQRALVATGVRSARRLGLLVHDLVRVSQAEQGGMTIRVAPFDPVDPVERAVADVQFIGLDDVSVQIDAEVVGGARGDSAQIEQAVAHLLANAAEHSGAGGQVHVRVTDGADTWMLEVADSGAGRDQADMARLFTAPAPGTALGLVLVTQVVRAHGGTIDVVSQVSRGTTVSVVIPKRPVC